MKNTRGTNRLLQLALLSAVTGLAMGASARADTSYYFEGSNTANWYDIVTMPTDLEWASPLSSSPLGAWTSSATSDAVFSANDTMTLEQSVTMNSLILNQTGSVNILSNAANTFTLTLNSISNTIGGQGVDFEAPITSAGTLTITGVAYPNTNSKGVTLDNTNILPDGVLLTGGSVYFNIGGSTVPGTDTNQSTNGANNANRYIVEGQDLNSIPASTLNSYNGTIPGTNSQTSMILETAISGPNSLTTGIWPTVTVAGNGSTITVSGNMHVNDYEFPNPIALNPNNVANFYTGLGSGSVLDSANSTTAGPFPQFNLMNFAGQISGNGNVIVTNDFFGGGGKGLTMFSNTSNNYTGQTIVNVNGPNYERFIIGGQQNSVTRTGPVPMGSDLIFGAQSLGNAIGDAAKIQSKSDGAMDLNGYDVTVKSLSSDMPAGEYTLGITNINNHLMDPLIPTGTPSGNGGTTSTLTLDSQGTSNNTFFTGNIWDGSDFLTQSTTTGSYPGPYTSAAAINDYVKPSQNGLLVAINLAATNNGVLTLNATNGSVVPDYGYSGGTTINGGSLYVNGTLTTSTASVASSVVVVNTPTVSAINPHPVSVLGGVGTIMPNIHVFSGATLAPGSTPTAAATGAYLDGSSYTAAPTVFNIGTLTVKNLTMDGGSNLNFILNNGAGSSTPELAFTAGGTFTEAASVTHTAPILVNVSGAFSGFANYAPATWVLANFPAAFDVQTFAINNATSPVSGVNLNQFSLTDVNNSLELSFAPSQTVVALQYTGTSTAANWNSNATGNKVWIGIPGTSLSGQTTYYSDSAYTPTPDVLFGTPTNSANSPINATLTVQAAGVSPTSVLFQNSSAGTYTLTGGTINGATGLSLNGTGRVIFQASNTYTGGTNISGGGTIETQVNGALGVDSSAPTGDLTIFNGTWNTSATDQAYALNVNVAGATTSGSTMIQTGPTTGNGAGNLAITGNVYGSGALTKTGVDNLTINGNMTEAGVFITAGKLIVNGTPPVSGITSISSGAAIEYQSSTSVSYGPTLVNNGNMIFDKAATVQFSPGSYPVGGTVTLTTADSAVQGFSGTPGGVPVDIGYTIKMNSSSGGMYMYLGEAGNNNPFSLHGVITGTGDLHFANGQGGGGGALISLYSQSTYVGNTYLENSSVAWVKLFINNALPTATTLQFGDVADQNSGSGFFDLNGHTQTLAGILTDPAQGPGASAGLTDSSGGGTLIVNGGTSDKFTSLVSGFMNLTVSMVNNANLTLSWSGGNIPPGQINPLNFGNTNAGFMTVTSGELRFDNPLAFSPNANVILNGGVMGFNADQFASQGGVNYQLGFEEGAAIQVTTGTSGFSAYSTTPGSTTVGVVNLNGGGTIQYGAASFFNPTVLVLNAASATNPLNFENGLDFNGAVQTIAVNSSGASAAATISGAIINTSGTASGLIKTGPGILILTNTNTYNGPTTIQGGTLQLSSTGSINNTSSIIVGDTAAHNTANLDVSSHVSGLTITSGQALGGFGTVLGTINVNSGGHVAPGSAGVAGTLNINNGLILNDGSVLDFTLSGTTTVGAGVNGLINVTGSNLTFGGAGGGTLNITASALTNGTYTLVTAPGVSGTLGTWTVGSIIGGAEGHSFSFSVVNNDAFDLTVTGGGSPAAIAVTPSSGGALLVGSTVQVTNNGVPGADTANLSSVTLSNTGVSNGTFTLNGLSNSTAVSAGTTQTGTIGFTATNGSVALLNGVQATGTLNFNAADGGTNGPATTGTGTYGYTLSTTPVTGNTGNGTANIGAGGTYGSLANPLYISRAAGTGSQLTKVLFLGGTASVATTINVTFANGGPTAMSDKATITGTGSDMHAIEMSYNPALLPTGSPANSVMLGWLNNSLTTPIFQAAVLGNTGGTPHEILGAYQSADLVLGDYGVDTTNDQVWAVVNNTGTYEAVSRIPGDINGDGTIDTKDFDIWFSHLGQTSNLYSLGDINGDGSIDTKDFDIWFRNLGLSVGAGAASPQTILAEQQYAFDVLNGTAVPEPATLGVLALGAIGMLARRKERHSRVIK